jgi:hypothetical protein
MNDFKKSEVAALLVACHRCCCICHKFCGIRIETHHIHPKAEGGSSRIDNAIPVCFDCHAEINSYNPDHPRGRKFTPEELRKHKEQWIALCGDKADMVLRMGTVSEAGPVEALLNELEFNILVAQARLPSERGCPLKDTQFNRAIERGAIWTLPETVRHAILNAYASVGRANHFVDAELRLEDPGNIHTHHRLAESQIQWVIKDAAGKCREAQEILEAFLGIEEETQDGCNSGRTAE